MNTLIICVVAFCLPVIDDYWNAADARYPHVRASDIRRFVATPEEITFHFRAARDKVNSLSVWPCGKKLIAAYLDAEWRFTIWNALDAVHRRYSEKLNILREPERVRLALGDEDYYAGTLPASVAPE